MITPPPEVELVIATIKQHIINCDINDNTIIFTLLYMIRMEKYVIYKNIRVSIICPMSANDIKAIALGCL